MIKIKDFLITGILFFSLLSLVFSQELVFVNALEMGSSEILSDNSLNYLNPTDLDWTDISIYHTGNATLLDTTSDDYFEYSISDTMIYLHEVDTHQCMFGLYAKVPVKNDFLAFSCEFRSKADLADVRNGIIRFFDSNSLERINNTPIFMSQADGVSLDSGYDYLGGNFSFEGYTEVIMFIYMGDIYAANWNLECWVRNLRIYTEGQLPLKNSLPPSIPLNYYNWTCDTYGISTTGSLTPFSGGEFSYSVNQSHVLIEEQGSGTNNAYVGVSTTIPIYYDFITFAFEAKISSDSTGESTVHYRIYDSVTKQRIYPHVGLGFFSIDNGETGFNYFELNISKTGFDEVEILFFYRDISSINDNHKLWIRNFRHQYPIEYDNKPPIITSVNEYVYKYGIIGNFLNWTLEDENPYNYTILRDGLVLCSYQWSNNETVFYNVDLLPVGTYNYTLVAYDCYENKAAKTILVIVIPAVTELTTIFALIIFPIVLVTITYLKHDRRKRSKLAK